MEVELIGASEHDQAIDPLELRDRRRLLGLLLLSPERRPPPGLGLERTKGTDELAHRNRPE